MRVLAICSAYGGAAVAIVQDGRAIASGRVPEEHGLAAVLPALVAELLGSQGREVGLVAAIVGPGSFTGLRAGLSVAHGVGLGCGVPVAGVTVAEAFAQEADGGTSIAGRDLWTAVHARRGRVFIDGPDGWLGYATDALPVSTRKVAVCGNAANLVAGALAAHGTDVMLTPLRQVEPVHLAGVALGRLANGLPFAPALPLYVDRAEARLPQTGLRPPPLGAAA